MARSRSYQKKRRASNKRFLLTIALIIILSVAYHFYSTRAMNQEINALDKEISSSQKKIEAIDNDITNLEEDYKIRNTDDFKEKVAQERLGMVKNPDNDDDN